MQMPVTTNTKCMFVNITQKVREAVAQSGVQEGMALIYCPHTTAGITINENADPDVCEDLLAALSAAVPKLHFAHMEGNSDAHFKALLTGNQTVVPVENGQLALGRWQGIYFCEYDGPRSRHFSVHVMSGK